MCKADQHALLALHPILQQTISALSRTTLCLSLHCRSGGRVVTGIDAERSILAGISVYFLHHFTLSNVLVIFYFYPSAVQSLLEIFDCDSVDTRNVTNNLMVRRSQIRCVVFFTL